MQDLSIGDRVVHQGVTYDVFRIEGAYVGLVDPELPPMMAKNDQGVEFQVAHLAVRRERLGGVS